MKFLPVLLLFLLFFGKGFEVLTVMSIHNVIWVRSVYFLVHMLVLGEHSQAIGRWRQYVLTETLVPTNQITRSLNLKQ